VSTCTVKSPGPVQIGTESYESRSRLGVPVG